MKIINDFLFCTQQFTDSEETRPTCINLASINDIRVVRNAILRGEEVVEVDLNDGSTILLDENPKTFFNEFAELLEDNAGY